MRLLIGMSWNAYNRSINRPQYFIVPDQLGSDEQTSQKNRPPNRSESVSIYDSKYVLVDVPLLRNRRRWGLHGKCCSRRRLGRPRQLVCLRDVRLSFTNFCDDHSQRRAVVFEKQKIASHKLPHSWPQPLSPLLGPNSCSRFWSATWLNALMGEHLAGEFVCASRRRFLKRNLVGD
jgi:hypothetical protein